MPVMENGSIVASISLLVLDDPLDWLDRDDDELLDDDETLDLEDLLEDIDDILDQVDALVGDESLDQDDTLERDEMEELLMIYYYFNVGTFRTFCHQGLGLPNFVTVPAGGPSPNSPPSPILCCPDSKPLMND